MENNISQAIMLSICIPTYNRAKFTAAAIESVLRNAHGASIEIIVCDNASTDDTKAVICDIVSMHPGIVKYHQNALNIGPERNFLRLINLAQGTYCWILGSDDEITHDAIPSIIDAMESRPDLILCDAIDCDKDLRETGVLKFLKLDATCMDFGDRRDIVTYLKSANMHASLFGYISSMIFNRQKWCLMPINRKFIGSGYVQVSRALDMLISSAGKLHYLAHPVAKNRRNNCSYQEEFGQLQRTLIDVRMFRRVLDEYFSSDIEVRNEYKEFVRRIYGHIMRDTAMTGHATIDEFLTTFRVDDDVLPEKKWQLRPKVERVKARLQSSGVFDRIFSGDSILHLGYRGRQESTLPINNRAIGVELGFAGYDGIYLPFENESQDAVWVSFCLCKIDTSIAVREWFRVLKPEGFLIVSSSVSDSQKECISSNSPLMSLSPPFDVFNDVLRNGLCRIFHCGQSEPVSASEDGLEVKSEMDLVLQKWVINSEENRE